MRQRILFLDLHAVLHAVKFSLGMKKQLSHKDKPTFVMFGFLFKLQFLMRKTKATKVIFAADSIESIRKRYYPLYKYKRQEKPKEIKELDEIAFPQFNTVIDYILPTIGYKNIFKAEGFEGDDLIARVCKNYKQHQFIIVSDDKDLYYLLGRDCCMYKIKNDVYYSYLDFVKEFDIQPKQWQRVKAYGGCSSDSVPGLPIPDSVKKIGQGLALKYVKGELPPHYKAYKAFQISENKKILRRNIRLTKIPLRETPNFEIVPDELSVSGLLKVCKEFNFKSVEADIGYWKNALKLR